VLARRKFSELLFGVTHPYGIDVTEKDFDRVNVEELKQFFNKYYTSNNCAIIAAGHLPGNMRSNAQQIFRKRHLGSIL